MSILFVAVIAKEFFVFLKTSRMILLMMLMALFILWLRIWSSSLQTWYICIFCFLLPYLPLLLPGELILKSSAESILFRYVEFRVVDVAGFVLKDKFDSACLKFYALWDEMYLVFCNFSLLSCCTLAACC